MRILLTGGGTLGSVSPLLATIPQLQAQKHEVRFIGTYTGPERSIVLQYHISFYAILAPKFHRFLTWKHLLIPFEFFIAFFQSVVQLLRWRPDVIVSAGGFVSVPLVWVGWFLRIPAIIHQQDLLPGMANKLMQPFAHNITVAFENSLHYFPKNKTEWIGNPVRDLTPTTDVIHIDPAYRTVLIFGGGTGAMAINEFVGKQLCEFVNVIHIIGKDRAGRMAHIVHPRYHQFKILGEEMKEALQKADIVVCRAGIGTITELATLGKPAIVIPMPHTHQEYNAAFLQKHHAAIILSQVQLSSDSFQGQIQDLLNSKKTQSELSQNIMKLQKAQATILFVKKIIHAVSQ